MNDQQQQPSVGRVVHYREQDGGDCLAAIVSAVSDDGGFINIGYLSVMGGSRQAQNISWGEEAGEWHWPERV